MSAEEQNDSPAFRLRPRRAAPKSYYTVRLEYSANPSAFIRERPRTSTKRKVFTSKTGSQQQQNQRYAQQSFENNNNNSSASGQTRPAVMSKEDREREIKRMLLLREISESISDSKMISPFIQRLNLNDLTPDTIYKHNYLTVRIKTIKRSTSNRLAYCLCESVDDSFEQLADEDDDTDTLIDTAPSSNSNKSVDRDETSNHNNDHRSPELDPNVSPIRYDSIGVILHDEYAQTPLLQTGKLLSIAKFRTSPIVPNMKILDLLESGTGFNGHMATTISTSESAQMFNSNSNDWLNNSNSSDDNNKLLPFTVIAKYLELDKGQDKSIKLEDDCKLETDSPLEKDKSDGAIDAKNKTEERYLIPFISITDLVVQPIEPFVEISPPSPSLNTNSNNNYNHHHLRNHQHHHYHSNDTNCDVKKVKFTANI